MKTLLLLTTITLTAFGVYLFKSKVELTDVPDYDMYVFSVQWGPAVCISYGDSCKEKLAQIPKNEMSIHGLWPSLQSGKRLPSCNDGKEVEIVEDKSELFKKMNKYWPSLVKTSKEFWGHEYNKHGYCYSNKIQDFDYRKYFEKALEVFESKSINTLITDVFGEHEKGEVSFPFSEFMEKLQEKLGGKVFGLSCANKNGKQYVQEIRLTLDLDFEYAPITIGGNCKSKKPVYFEFQ